MSTKGHGRHRSSSGSRAAYFRAARCIAIRENYNLLSTESPLADRMMEGASKTQVG